MAAARDFEDWYLVAALAVSCDEGLAADACAEACVRAFARWDRLATSENPTGWAYIVARREVARRRVRAEKERTSELEVLVARSPTTQRDLELWGRVDKLPERMRLAITLRYLGDFSEREVASLMNISRGGASALLHKAREALSEALREESPRGG